MARPKLFEQKQPFDFGKLVPVSPKKTSGGVLKVDLADGTKLELRIMLVDVKRSTDRHNANGEPVYAVNSVQMVKAEVPRRLRLVNIPATKSTRKNTTKTKKPAKAKVKK